MIQHSRNAGKSIAPVTLKTVANQAGCAVGTVSSILNRAPQSAAISQHTKDRVFAVARKLDYRPNLLARALRTGRRSAGNNREASEYGSRALVFDGEEHFQQAMNAIRQAGLRVPGDVSAW